jgi:NAD+ kinase
MKERDREPWVLHRSNRIPSAQRAQVEQSDLVFTYGGDGTMLYAARLMAGQKGSLLGVNLGRLGFLTEVDPPGLAEALDALEAGRYRIDSRMTLAIEVGGHTHQDMVAMNEVVLHKGSSLRMLRLDVQLGTQGLATLAADGVIVSTATGSTAYSLSTGGPVLDAAVNGIILAALNPHTLFNRALVLSGDTVVRLQVPLEDAMLTVDGQVHHPVAAGDDVVVRASDRPVRFVRLAGGRTFISRLQEKMKWAVPISSPLSPEG